MMIDGQIYPLHVAISSHWKIHYFTAEMAGDHEHRAEDAAFLENMPGVLGPVAMKALGQIQSTLGLDYGGIDFGLNAKRRSSGVRSQCHDGGEHAGTGRAMGLPSPCLQTDLRGRSQNADGKTRRINGRSPRLQQNLNKTCISSPGQFPDVKSLRAASNRVNYTHDEANPRPGLAVFAGAAGDSLRRGLGSAASAHRAPDCVFNRAGGPISGRRPEGQQAGILSRGNGRAALRQIDFPACFGPSVLVVKAPHTQWKTVAGCWVAKSYSKSPRCLIAREAGRESVPLLLATSWTSSRRYSAL